MVLYLYTSSVSPNSQIKNRQKRIKDVLDIKKIAYEEYDISVDDDAKQRMKTICKENRIVPQLCNDDKYIGDYEKFQEAVDEGNLEAFLKGC